MALLAVGGRVRISQLTTPFVKTQGVPPRTSVRQQAQILTESWFLYLMLAVSTGLMQLCTIVTLAQFQVGYALALFQTSVLISVFLGRKVFDEPHFLQRFAGATVMVAGTVLIILGR